MTSGQAWVGSIAYALQLYFDFSGYSDMAVASALFIGFRIPFNFDSPYKAMSIIEFWRRWHITLSRFLRDYLYIPLGGNRRGDARRYFNIFVTMLLGGIWHGAGVTFVIWGALHGTFIVINHLWRDRVVSRLSWLDNSTIFSAASYALTMLCVLIGWIFFRSETVGGAILVTTGLFHLPVDCPITPQQGYLIGISAAIAALMPNSKQIHDWLMSGSDVQYWTLGFAAAAIFVIAFVSISVDLPFLYFQF